MAAPLRGSRLGRGPDWLPAGSRAAVVMSVAGVLLTTTVLHTVDSYLTAQHLVLGYLLPTILVAIYYGSNVAVFTSFASGLAAAYFLFPPKLSFYITDITHVAELGFFLLLASIASKAVAVLADDSRRRNVTGRD
jgi:K+-sensing histidine kinase KdpD